MQPFVRKYCPPAFMYSRSRERCRSLISLASRYRCQGIIYSRSRERFRMFVSSASAPTNPPRPPRRLSPCFLRVRGTVPTRDKQVHPATFMFQDSEPAKPQYIRRRYQGLPMSSKPIAKNFRIPRLPWGDSQVPAVRQKTKSGQQTP